MTMPESPFRAARGSSIEPLAVDDGRSLRDAYALFPTGVAIITAISGGERVGMTVSSFATVSLAPPLVSFSVALSAKALEAWTSVTTFGVSILADTQGDLSTRFARSLADKWSGVAVRQGEAAGLPLIEGACGWLECAVHERQPGGDHVTVLGRVLSAARNREAAGRPLLFFGGAYRLVSAEGGDPLPDAAMWLHGW
ncbi:flavin reductase family protein [Lichenifustis flavocetrariae]|uniref:Flavin reductase family protein n=1 Tax=Lichenifustis flavocetrariae TaxID=2949735 RepID=A0AA42CLX1_9HYPH|nr:flavin reductase family protein [Lichenifustis flavocetrariae]MCW6507832.1 flavin reductase family protein [Lichenifustis flavocetrariae]